jgi:hypothetical protein
MSARWIRRIVWLVFLGGIGGMIAGSIADNNGMAITFGLLTAVAAVGLILVSSVAPPGSFNKARANEPPGGFDETTAADVEARIAALVAAGADEQTVRQLVQQAVRLGRSAHEVMPEV